MSRRKLAALAVALILATAAVVAGILASASNAEVEQFTDLSGYYRSRRLGAGETLCLRRDGTFVYVSPGPGGEPLRQTGHWQPVSPFAGSLLAVFDTVRFHGNLGMLMRPDSTGAEVESPETFLESRWTWTRRLVLIPAGETEVLFRRVGDENDCPTLPSAAESRT